uniref:Putative salivary secreted protein n=1 Tax=Triatoma infestans TaxID=30076 RepID=A6YPT4_TRIIF|nr:putative salivary secreted protein [Triatoma infestans]
MMRRLVLLLLIPLMVMGVSIITRNGKTDIYINNKKVDLSKATVIETTPDYTVYQPIEDENTTIVINKGGGVMVYSNGSVQISNGSKMTPQQQQEFKRKMEEFEKKMICERQALQQRLSNLGQEINNRVHDSLSNVFNDRFLRNLF